MWGAIESFNEAKGVAQKIRRADITVEENGQTQFTLSPPPLVPNTAELFVNGQKLTIGKDFTFSTNGVLTYLQGTGYPLETTDTLEINYF